MKKLVLLLAAIFLLSGVTAISNLEVKTTDLGSTIIRELQNPALFQFEIKNNGIADTFEIYSLSGVSITPTNRFNLANNETKIIQIRAEPNEELLKNEGFLTFKYEIKGTQTEIFKERLKIKITDIKNLLEIQPQQFSPEDKEAEIKIINKQNAEIENAELSFTSVFFDSENSVSLNPEGETTLKIKINKDTSNIEAGQYLITAKLEIENSKAEFEGVVNYLEKENVSTNKVKKGIVIKKTIITKTNEGNTQLDTSIELERGIISRLFTSNSPNADSIERKGLSVIYFWNRELAPNEKIEITSTTNYTLPVIIILSIVLITSFIKSRLKTFVKLNKKATFLRTKSGDFALKINLRVRAKHFVKNIQLSDTLPAMTKLYDKFGKKPDRIDEKSRKIFWNIQNLSTGEERIFSYVVYSKIRVIGRLELPLAIAQYETESGKEIAHSNRAFFASEIIQTN